MTYYIICKRSHANYSIITGLVHSSYVSISRGDHHCQNPILKQVKCHNTRFYWAQIQSNYKHPAMLNRTTSVPIRLKCYIIFSLNSLGAWGIISSKQFKFKRVGENNQFLELSPLGLMPIGRLANLELS